MKLLIANMLCRIVCFCESPTWMGKKEPNRGFFLGIFLIGLIAYGVGLFCPNMGTYRVLFSATTSCTLVFAFAMCDILITSIAIALISPLLAITAVLSTIGRWLFNAVKGRITSDRW